MSGKSLTIKTLLIVLFLHAQVSCVFCKLIDVAGCPYKRIILEWVKKIPKDYQLEIPAICGNKCKDLLQALGNSHCENKNCSVTEPCYETEQKTKQLIQCFNADDQPLCQNQNKSEQYLTQTQKTYLFVCQKRFLLLFQECYIEKQRGANNTDCTIPTSSPVTSLPPHSCSPERDSSGRGSISTGPPEHGVLALLIISVCINLVAFSCCLWLLKQRRSRR